jgi:hypothetical protein
VDFLAALLTFSLSYNLSSLTAFLAVGVWRRSVEEELFILIFHGLIFGRCLASNLLSAGRSCPLLSFLVFLVELPLLYQVFLFPLFFLVFL